MMRPSSNRVPIMLAADFKKAGASFPEGSDKGPPETYAKAEIWSDPEGFKAAFEKAVAAVDTLAMSTDEASFKAALPAVWARPAEAVTRNSAARRIDLG